MAVDWSFVPSLISAGSGLSGVWLGGWLTNRRDATRERDRINKESSYLAILVLAHLDRFVNGCVQVALDDGTSEGRPAGKDGEYHQVTAQAPTFEPLALQVDWKVLPADLMYGILNLPYKAEQLANLVTRVGEFDDPLDYTDFFWARQHGYSLLGLEVSAIARSLREHASLPSEKPTEGEWNRDDLLKEQRDEIERKRAEYQDRLSSKVYSPPQGDCPTSTPVTSLTVGSTRTKMLRIFAG